VKSRQYIVVLTCALSISLNTSAEIIDFEGFGSKQLVTNQIPGITITSSEDDSDTGLGGLLQVNGDPFPTLTINGNGVLTNCLTLSCTLLDRADVLRIDFDNPVSGLSLSFDGDGKLSTFKAYNTSGAEIEEIIPSSEQVLISFTVSGISYVDIHQDGDRDAYSIDDLNFEAGATLQINGPNAPAAPDDWDETIAIQTGNVSGADIQATLSALHWSGTFQDENGPYASTFFGPLAQPVSSGDFMLIQAAPSFGVFTLTITLLDSLTKPTFYLSDVDRTNAVVTFEPGANQTTATNGAFAGNVFTSDGTSPGGWAAALYSGTFGSGSIFTFSFDYSNVTIAGSELIGFGIGIHPPPVDLTGTIKTPDGQDVCAMVLASGKFMFSCNPIGELSLTGLPREPNGTVKRQIYADGFLPKIDILPDSLDEAVVMTRSGVCPTYNPPANPGFFPGAAGSWIDISGSVEVGENGDPICAMVLANGQFMFSCDGTGSYALNIRWIITDSSSCRSMLTDLRHRSRHLTSSKQLTMYV
jgi:hypothetical protein